MNIDILLSICLASLYLSLLTRYLGVSSINLYNKKELIIIGNPNPKQKVNLQLLKETNRIGKITCPIAQPVIKVTKDNLLNLSAPISDT